MVGALLTNPPSFAPAWCCFETRAVAEDGASFLRLLCHTTEGGKRRSHIPDRFSKLGYSVATKGGGVEKNNGGVGTGSPRAILNRVACFITLFRRDVEQLVHVVYIIRHLR
ncbi:unnamed protein product [Ectocarpus sp. 13 AM-2016]